MRPGKFAAGPGPATRADSERAADDWADVDEPRATSSMPPARNQISVDVSRPPAEDPHCPGSEGDRRADRSAVASAGRRAGAGDPRRRLRRVGRRRLCRAHHRRRRRPGPHRQGEHLPPLAEQARTGDWTHCSPGLPSPTSPTRSRDCRPTSTRRTALLRIGRADRRFCREPAGEAVRAVGCEARRDPNLAAALDDRLHHPTAQRDARHLPPRRRPWRGASRSGHGAWSPWCCRPCSPTRSCC